MTDEMLARELRERLDQFIDREGEWETKGEAEQEITAMLARVRLDEAKWWANGEHTSKGALAMNMNRPCQRCERIRTLEQAAGGSAAAKEGE